MIQNLVVFTRNRDIGNQKLNGDNMSIHERACTFMPSCPTPRRLNVLSNKSKQSFFRAQLCARRRVDCSVPGNEARP